MSAERFRRVRDLVDEALRRETADRVAFLIAECGDDDLLRREVETLVDARRKMGDYLDRPAVESVDPVLSPGARLGSFEILSVVGRGGGGVVYEARQDRPRRRVALKVMRADFGSEWARRRFREEAELLARLKHPGIAHVYEAGVHDGVPYFALEFVDDARDIVAWSRTLEPRARLELVARLCDAVHHGHQQGVVHRDLKPGNVLVDGSGQVKVIDFGIARVSGAAEEVAGTPPYMSPEQCGSDAHVDVRSDVYSLGVLLYEILSGVPPHDVAGLPLTDALRRVRELDPVAIGDRDRRWRGEVESIVSKAMQRDPSVRYASASALGADLRRLLRHQPVAAHPPSALYHLRKFVRRNTVQTVAVLAILLVSVAAALISREQAAIARRARGQAEYRSYLASIAAADAALRVLDVQEAKRHLAGAHEDHRGWEWRYLSARADGSQRTGTGPAGGSVVAAFGAEPSLVYGNSNAPYRASSTVCAWEAATGDLRFQTGLAEGFVENVAVRSDGRLVAWCQGWALRFANERLEQPVSIPVKGLARVRFRPGTAMLVAVFDQQIVVVDTAAAPGAVPSIVDRRIWPSPIHALEFDRAGERIVLGLADGTVAVLRFPGLEPVRTLRAHRGRVRDVCFSRDGTRVASASEDGTVAVWGTDGELVRRIRRHRGWFGAVRFARGERVFTGHSDGTVILWNIRTGNQIVVHAGHEGAITSLALVEDGDVLVSGSKDGTWKMWDAGKPGVTLGRHRDVVRDLATGPDGRLAACAIFDGSTKVYDLKTRALVADLAVCTGRVATVRLADGRSLWTGSNDALIREWDPANGKLKQTLRGHAAPLCAVLPHEDVLLSGSEDGTVRVWDRSTGRERMRFAQPGWVWDLAVEPRAGVFAAPAWEHESGFVRVRALRDGAIRADLAVDAEVVCLAFSPDGSRLFAGARDGSVRRWRVADWNEEPALAIGKRGVERIAFTPDGSRVAFACGRVIRLWDAVTVEPVLTLRRHVRDVFGLAFSPDGNTLLSGGGHAGKDCQVRVWDAAPRR